MFHEFHRWKPFSTHVEPMSLTIFPGMRSFSEKLIWIFLIVTLLMNSTLVLWTLHVSNCNPNRAIIRFSWRLQIKKKSRICYKQCIASLFCVSDRVMQQKNNQYLFSLTVFEDLVCMFFSRQCENSADNIQPFVNFIL